jgi:hypothetical protein
LNPDLRMKAVPPERAWLRPGLHAAPVGSDLILLDLQADDYLCLPDCPGLEVLGDLVRGPIEALLRLSAEELITGANSRPEARRGPPPLPVTGLPAAPGVRPSPWDVLEFAAIWIDVVRSRPTIRRLERRTGRRRGRKDDVAAIAARVEVFRQLLPLAPWTGACLLQAELLLRFLNAADLDADWVFGVRLWPFLAHCWLQIDELCVSESPDTLASYHPILVL